MSFIRIFIILATIAFANICYAQAVDEASARTIGIDFLNSKKIQGKAENPTNLIPANQSYELAYTSIKDGKVCFYVYNCSNGGFVIVSADNRTDKPVLGYSTKGFFDYNSLGKNAQWLLNSYKKQIIRLDTIAHEKHPRKTKHKTKKLSKSVAPLLGETAWGQDSPYNLMCPEIDGQNCLTGCCATAMAQIMYFHKWPERGNGVIQYQPIGYIEADLSQSEYQWDLMLPKYDENSSLESQRAVALLMRDCGYSLETAYGLESSGAGGSAHAFWENFNYDKGMISHPADSYDSDEWNEIIINEIDNLRPVLFSGGCHEYVCDGYDDDEYYHFNFGWSGAGDGYFLCSANGFEEEQMIICGIEKNHGGEERISFDALQSFMYSGQPSISFKSSISTTCEENIQCFTAFEDKSTGEVYLLDGEFSYTFSKAGQRSFNFRFDGISLTDGEYSVYPVVKLSEVPDSEITKCHFRSDMQTHVDLLVINGEQQFSNEFNDNLPDGMVKVNGLYYQLDESNNTAAVTTTDDMKGLYLGDIIIPGSIYVSDKEFMVTSIAEEAFMDCYPMNVSIGENVEKIEKNAFRNSYIDKFSFASGSKLKYIGDYAFLCHLGSQAIVLPEGVISIGEVCFNLEEGITEITLPSTLKEIGKDAFRGCDYLREIVIKSPIPFTRKYRMFNFFNYPKDLSSKIKLYVPEGSKDSYLNAEPWSDFDVIEGIPSYEYVIIDENEYRLSKPSMTATLQKLNNENQNCILPELISYQNESFPLDVVDQLAASMYEGAPSITSLYISKHISQLRRNSFSNQQNLKSIEFDDNSDLWDMGPFCFQGAAIESIKLPSSLMVIGLYALSYCPNLKTVDIPSSVVNMGQGVFHSCVSLRDVFVRWTDPLIPDLFCFENCDYSQMKLHVPKGTKEKYATTPPWSDFNEIIEEDVLSVDEIFDLSHQFTGGDIYNISGSLIMRDASQADFRHLPSGFYIINGKKVLIH